jgi:NitT/TauT family transport system permease protein
MKRIINIEPSSPVRWILFITPFLLTVAAYVVSSNLRLSLNAEDKLLPSLSAIGSAIYRLAFVPDPRTGDYLLWTDTAASLGRLFPALAISVAIGLVLGVLIGLIPLARSALGGFMDVVSFIPPLALLPILFIALGLGETTKVILLVIGITPFLVRSMAMKVGELPREQIIKAQSLGGSSWLIALKIVIPQLLPSLLDGIRLSIGPALLYLIAAEAIASEVGLGYRIFLVRRYLEMDVIIPYVAWITLLAFVIDAVLAMIQRKLFPWFQATR